ncbi:MAG TPA: FAD-dependent oxidoreductase [Lunatimonas sp.]|nr:FAD-dependent oxidoreductase [Lunatimonas sp.]
MEVDFLLIGQGLSGTVLSHRLLQNGYSVHLLDEPNPRSSSRVAAGLYNPVTGRKMVKTWEADTLFPEIEPFYSSLEELLGINCLYRIPIYRPFLNIEEQNEWMGNSSRPEFLPYIESIYTESQFGRVNDPFGGVLLNRSGYLDIKSLLDGYASWLKDREMLTNKVYDESKLKLIEGGGVEYEGINARAVVYTNGMAAKESAYLSWLPFTPVRGEILTLNLDFQTDGIVNRGVFVIPLPNGHFKVGSTYDNLDMISGATEKGKLEILDKLANLINLSEHSLIKHEWGIRPATPDRKPFLGRHPVHGQIYVFNGFGAKGVSQTPYFSEEMQNLLTLGKEPQKAVNINRFFKYI